MVHGPEHVPSLPPVWVEPVSVQVPAPGDIGLTVIGGPVGVLVSLLQTLAARKPSRWTHAFIVLPDGDSISAQPGGARRTPLAQAASGKTAYMPVPAWANRDEICRWAIEHDDLPYSFLSYLWIGLEAWGFRLEWLLRRIASDRTMICSAFADRAWMAGGVACFDDGRPLGSVTPSDLAGVGPIVNVGRGPYHIRPRREGVHHD
jgi:hypothetical protein